MSRQVNFPNALKVALVLSMAVNVGLVRRIRIVEHANIVLKSQHELAKGDHIGPISVVVADGTLSNIRFDDAAIPTLIYVLTPTCIFCKHNLPNMKALINQAQGKYRIVLVSLVREGIEEYRRTHEISVPISTISQQSSRDLQIGGTPSTLLVSRTGELLAEWVGAFNSDQKRQIEGQLSVSLPGLN
jgi:hypothetical protein